MSTPASIRTRTSTSSLTSTRTRTLTLMVALLIGGVVRQSVAEDSAPLLQYGGMRLALAQGQDEARVALVDVGAIPHFFGVGAMAGLGGEITVLDSEAFVTVRGDVGNLEAVDPNSASATLLVGQSIDEWSEVVLEEDVLPGDFDGAVREAAEANGLDPAVPFVFVVEGEVTDARLHVIHGACPVHARMNKLEIPAEQAPYELDVARLQGTVVGVYAEDAVGKLTHPATSTHAHIIFVDPETGATLTAHLEKRGLAPGALVKVPRKK
ncbi:MAG: acetolactate decarboxylase [Candidatus Eisenbacteria bacterium]